VILGLAAALAAAVAFGVASVLQAVGSRRLATAAPDARLLLRLLRSLPYLAGLGLDGVGFAATVVALRTLPLFVVESAIASSVGVTALVAVRWLGARLGPRERVALAGMLAGLVLLAVSAEAEGAVPLPAAGGWLVLGLSVVVALLAAAATRMPPARAVAVLAVAAGLGFAGTGIATRALEFPDPLWRILLDPLLWALALDGLLALTCYAAALQRGAVTVVAAVTLAVETLLPAIVGYAVLGDRARPGFLPVAVVGLLLTLAGAVALARYSEPETPDVSPRYGPAPAGP
jgi:multidrug transporter EmrE-like cation transporter